MEALQCTEANTEAVIVATTSEPNRILKRNIGELAVDGKLNGKRLWLKCYFDTVQKKNELFWFCFL